MEILSWVLITIGLFFLVVSAVGLVRLPDFFTRVHAVSKSETLGVTMVLLGLVVHEGITIVSIKLVLAVVFVFLTNPLGAHLLTRAAVRTGVMPWRRREPGVEEAAAGAEQTGGQR